MGQRQHKKASKNYQHPMILSLDLEVMIQKPSLIKHRVPTLLAGFPNAGSTGAGID